MDFTRLPEDIPYQIYKDHFSNESKYKKLQSILDSDESSRLDYIPLYEHLKNENILSDSYYVNYLQNKNKIFNTIFKHHYVDKKKYFVKLGKLESFSLSWLMYLYH